MLWAQSTVFYLLTFTVLTEICSSSPAFALSYYVFVALCVSPYRGFICHQGRVHASCLAWAWHQPLGPGEGRSRHAGSGRALGGGAGCSRHGPSVLGAGSPGQVTGFGPWSRQWEMSKNFL